MYKIIGADGREYGPIAADQLRQWIAEGRANAQSKVMVMVEGSTDWQRLGELPEFASDLGPQPGKGSSVQSLVAMIEPPPQVSVGDWMSRGWELLRSNFWLLFGATAVVILLLWAATFIPLVGSLLLDYVLLGGLAWIFLKRARGQKTEFEDVFAGFSALFIPLMLYSLVAQVLTLIGYVLCILPGIYLTIVWLLFPVLLIMDKGMDFWPAMELSRKVVHRHFWPVFGLFCLIFLLVVAGLVTFLVGVFLTLPISVAAVVCAYEDLFGARRAEQEMTVETSAAGTPPQPEV
jgi:hypothetical protein